MSKTDIVNRAISLYEFLATFWQTDGVSFVRMFLRTQCVAWR
jgi:hypothetical protein